MQIWPEVPYCLHHLQQLVSGHTIVPLSPIQGVTVVSHNAIAPDTYVAGIGVHNESLLGIGVGQDRGFGEGCLELGEVQASSQWNDRPFSVRQWRRNCAPAPGLQSGLAASSSLSWLPFPRSLLSAGWWLVSMPGREWPGGAGRPPGRTREMVERTSTMARQRLPSSWQLRYSGS